MRALAALLPDLDVVVGCRFSCDPAAPGPRLPGRAARRRPSPHRRRPRLVELPVGATEDRLVGSLDLERALAEGVRAYQPGLLADAHRGVLYVDEVNLLHDHLVDALLDAAAMGRAHVERDGVSVSHAARFLLVGTMNPEEGELRPQLLDRFGLAVEVRAARDVATRAEVVRRRLAFDDDPRGFAASVGAGRARDGRPHRRRAGPRRRGGAARRRAAAHRRGVRRVRRRRHARRPRHRPRRHRARRLAGRGGGRRRRTCGSRPGSRCRTGAGATRSTRPGVDEQALDDAMEQAREEAETGPDDPDGPGGGGGGEPDDRDDEQRRRGRRPGDRGRRRATPGWSESARPAPDGQPIPPRRQPDGAGRRAAADGRAGARPTAAPRPRPAPTFRARRLVVPGVGEGAPGRRSRARTELGRVVRASVSRPPGAADLHLPATVPPPPRTSTPAAASRRLLLRPADVRHAVREGREGNLVLFAVDASGSMAARRGWPPSAARCCRCCATPTSAATRSA